MDLPQAEHAVAGASAKAYRSSSGTWRGASTGVAGSAACSEGAETLLAGYSGSSSLADRTITSTSFAGQYFFPTFPAAATGWRVTKVQFNARINGGSTGQTNVQLRNASGTLPGTTVLESVALMENTLASSYATKTLTFSASSGLTPTAGACIVFYWVSDTQSCDTQYQSSAATGANTNCFTSTNGTTWTAPASRDALFGGCCKTLQQSRKRRRKLKAIIASASSWKAWKCGPARS